MTGLTEKFKTVFSAFVLQYLPDEAPMFSELWKTFWQSYHFQNIEDLGKVLENDRKILPVYLTNNEVHEIQKLSTPHFMQIFCFALAAIKKSCNESEVKLNVIENALKQECNAQNTPAHFYSLLFGPGLALLSSIFNLKVPKGVIYEYPPEKQFWIEYRSQSGRDYEFPNADCGWFTEKEACEKFRKNNSTYDLFVDETLTTIRLPKIEKHIPWADLKKRQRNLLYMILKALPCHCPITFESIYEKAISNDHARNFDPYNNCNDVAKLHSQLNRFFGSFFKCFIKAEHGMRQYAFVKTITYCWIRPDNQTSRLSTISKKHIRNAKTV